MPKSLVNVEPQIIRGNPAVHLSLQGKGGVGKSLIASFLAQYYKSHGVPPPRHWHAEQCGTCRRQCYIAVPTVRGSDGTASSCPHSMPRYAGGATDSVRSGKTRPASPSSGLRRTTMARRFQIAHHSEELVALSPVDLIHPEVPQRRIASLRVPPLQTAQIDCPHRTLSQSESPGYLPRRCTLAGLRHRILKALTERCFAGKKGHFLYLHSAFRTLHSVDLNMHRGPKCAPGQIANRALIAVMDLDELTSAARTFQFAVAALAPHPQIQRLSLLSLLVDHLAINPISGPLQDACEFVVRRQLPNYPEVPFPSRPRQYEDFTDSRSEPKIFSPFSSVSFR